MSAFNPFVHVTALLMVLVSFEAVADEKNLLFSNPLIRETIMLPEIKALRFITVDGFEPFSSFDDTGTLRGIHVDLARGVCTVLKITDKCTLQVASFETTENLLTTDKADVALAGLVPTVQNRAKLHFSVPYFRYPSRFLALKGVSQKQGDMIGVIAESAHQEMAKLLFPNLRQTAFTNQDEAVAALKNGTVSALFGDGLNWASLLASNTCCELQPGNYFLPLMRPDTLRAATARSRNDVLAAVNSALRQMEANGSLEEIYLRYLPNNPLQ